MKINLKVIPYLIVNALAFYLLPLLIQDTGSAMLILLIGMPFICFVTAVVFGAQNSFQWLYALIVAMLFIPSIFIFYNSSAWVYPVAYGILALIGNFIGKMLFQKNRSA